MNVDFLHKPMPGMVAVNDRRSACRVTTQAGVGIHSGEAVREGLTTYMRRFCRASGNLFPVALMAVLLSGCVTENTAKIPDAAPDLLKFLKVGQTTREEVVLKLGAPFVTFELEKVQMFQVFENPKQGYYVNSANRVMRCMDDQYRLVLVFDDRRVLQRQSLVNIGWGKDLLEFLKVGQTTREQVFLNLGEPSATFESAKVLTYCVSTKHKSDYRILHQQLPEYKWLFVDYSLVLVFEDDGVLERTNLVKVR